MVAQRASVGGVGVHMRTLGKQLIGDGWDVCLAANWESPRGKVSAHVFEDAGIATAQVSFPEVGRRVSLAGEMIRAGRELRALIRHEQPDVLHVHWRTTLPYLALGAGAPVVFTLHTLGTRGASTRALYRIPRHVIAISQDLAHELTTSLGVPANRVRYVPNGVPITNDEPLTPYERIEVRHRLGLPADAFLIITVARLELVKRHDVTLRALRMLIDQGRDDLHLVLVGDGSLRTELSNQVETLKLTDHVTFTGHREPEEYLRVADVFVLVSEREGFPLAAVEAMMQGLPLIRTPTGGTIDQIVEGQTGHIVRHGDAAALAEAVTRMHVDRDGRFTMGVKSALKARREFSTLAMASATAQVYREAMGSSRSAPLRSASGGGTRTR